MAAKNEKMTSWKVLVDKKHNRVVFVESDKDFVDILFKFFTMPMGTIVRLTREQLETTTLGSMSTLYQSLESLEEGYFEKEITLALLLRPRNSYGHRCRDLKLNMDDTEETTYYMCDDMFQKNCFSGKHSTSLGTSQLDRCSCGKLMDKKIWFNVLNDGVFVQGRILIVIDNRKVIPQCTKPNWPLPKDLGIKEVVSLEEKIINLGLKEVLVGLLRLSFTSMTSLTDVLLKSVNHTSTTTKGELEETHYILKSEDTASSGTTKITIKLNIRKSNNKVLYEETGEDFEDFLFSLLTIP
ncbi:hypothetical protein GIB67_036144 [Kingdonia uniflora]|uniref:DUF674 family protein n=1 Tax=Kingdonia uniflora TaxID=39325 RepID=A0A7J7N9I6_9MAGN|nr:hypothetical protein GIB67_036144 [Kingdonia uniflora]